MYPMSKSKKWILVRYFFVFLYGVFFITASGFSFSIRLSTVSGLIRCMCLFMCVL